MANWLMMAVCPWHSRASHLSCRQKMSLCSLSQRWRIFASSGTAGRMIFIWDIRTIKRSPHKCTGLRRYGQVPCVRPPTVWDICPGLRIICNTRVWRIFFHSHLSLTQVARLCHRGMSLRLALFTGLSFHKINHCCLQKRRWLYWSKRSNWIPGLVSRNFCWRNCIWRIETSQKQSSLPLVAFN